MNTIYKTYHHQKMRFGVLSKFLRKNGIYIKEFTENIFNRGQLYHFLGTSILLYSRKISSPLEKSRGIELTIVSDDIKKSEKVAELLENYLKNNI